MIPLELQLEGFLSYRNRQRLDFRPLIDAGLFGILGPTGSGKSALLEAILLALYGSCSRGELRTLVNRRCSTLAVELCFQLHRAEGTELYRCVYRARIAPDGRGIRQQEHLLERWTGHGWSTVRGAKTRELVSEVLGLEYENFCRSILLPQGRFDEFLSLRPSERAHALESLFGLQQYNLSATIRQLSKDADARYDTLRQRAEQLAQATSETTLQHLRQEYEQLEIRCRILEHRLTELKTADEQQSTYRHRWEEAQRLRYELEQHQQRLAASADRKRLLEQLCRCLPTLQPLWQQLQQLRRETADVVLALRRTRQEHVTLQSELNRLEAHHPELAHGDDFLRHLRERHQHYHTALACCELQHQLSTVERQRLRCASLLQQLQSRREELARRLESIHHAQRQLHQELHSLTELLSWYQREQDLQHQRYQLTEELRDLEFGMEGLLENLRSRCSDIPEPFRPRAHQAELFLQELCQAEEELRKTTERLHTELEQLRHHIAAAELARHLSPGHPCPVCGSLQHPAPHPPAPEAETRLSAIRGKIEHLAATFALLQRLQSELQTHLHRTAESRRRLTERLRRLEEVITAHHRLFRWEAFSPSVAQKSSVEERLRELHAELSHHHTEEQRLRQQLRVLERRLETVRQAYQHYEAQQSALAAQYELLHSALPEELRHYPPQELPSMREHIRQQLQQLEDEEHTYQSLRQRVDSLRHRSEEIRLRLTFLEERHATLENTQDRLSRQFEELCAAHGLTPVAIQPFLERPLEELLAELSCLNEDERRCAILAQQLATLESEAAQYNPHQHAQLRHQLEALQAELSLLHTQRGQLQERLCRLEQDLAERTRLEKELEDLRLRTQRLKTLDELFRGNAFVNFIAQEYLRSLCHQANRYFRQWTHGALELTVLTTGGQPDVCVCDMLSNGLLRPIRTLSGGQLFQASLALALALSDMVRSASRLQRCLLFIDEGFGSLDRDSLYLVLDTLRQLQRQGRLIGVISHREELQHELDLSVRVRHDPHRGSVIESDTRWSTG